MFFKQCVLKKNKQSQVAWLPEVFAHRGAHVELEINGKWEDGWHILEVGQHRMSGEDVSRQSQDHKHQRKVSDI